jgi:hypothetical protein
MIRTTGYVMTTVSIGRALKIALLAAGMLAAAAAHAGGPQVTFYVTMPLFGDSSARAPSGRVLGLRLDRTQAVSDIRNLNPSSPLNRRALLDLQLGAHSALRLELDRQLTWDIYRQEWRASSRQATFTVRIPTHEAASNPVDHSSWVASLADPFQNQGWKPLVKPLAIEP